MHGKPYNHTRPLDSLIIATEESHCRWCRMWLWILRRHIERDIVPFYPRRDAR